MSAANAFVPENNDQLVIPIASQTARYWKATIYNPTIIPALAELWIGPTVTWLTNYTFPSGDLDDKPNVDRQVASAGKPRYWVKGQTLRQRNYDLLNVSPAQMAEIDTLQAAWDGHNPFWFCDEDGIWIFGELISPVKKRKTANSKYGYSFNFLEVPR